MIQFLQLNLHNSKQAFVELTNNLDKMNKGVALVQEPHTLKGRISLKTRNYAIFPSLDSVTNPRSAIIANKELALMEVSHLNSKFTTVVAGLINKTKIMLASIYAWRGKDNIR